MRMKKVQILWSRYVEVAMHSILVWHACTNANTNMVSHMMCNSAYKTNVHRWSCFVGDFDIQRPNEKRRQNRIRSMISPACGGRAGVVVKTLAAHHCGPGSIPGMAMLFLSEWHVQCQWTRRCKQARLCRVKQCVYYPIDFACVYLTENWFRTLCTSQDLAFHSLQQTNQPAHHVSVRPGRCRGCPRTQPRSTLRPDQ